MKNNQSTMGRFIGDQEYRLGDVITVREKKEIFSVAFNHFLGVKRGLSVFAVCGVGFATVFECFPDGSTKCLIDFIEQEDKFYTCTWSITRDGKSILLFAGARSTIRAQVLGDDFVEMLFTGQEGSINELKVATRWPHLLFSASKNTTVHLINVHTQAVIAIFSQAHRDQILSIDIHDTLWCFASCGIDHKICIWSLKSEKIQNAIEASNHYNNESPKNFKTVFETLPHFSTRDVHQDYIDCVRFLGDFIMTKSVKNRIVLWRTLKPLDKILNERPQIYDVRTGQQEKDEINISIMHWFKLKNCKSWFCRFAVDPARRYLIMGNSLSTLYVWNIADSKFEHRKIPSYKNADGLVRQIDFNWTSDTFVVVNDDGNVLVYNILSKK